MIILLILSVLLSIPVTLRAIRKAKELPDSVSSFSYYIGDIRFSLWIASVASLLLFPMLYALPTSLTIVGGLVSAGLLMVAASPYYRTERKVIHYFGGYLFGVASQVVVAILEPWLLCLWTFFPFIFIKHEWRENATFISEAICVLSLVASITIKLY